MGRLRLALLLLALATEMQVAMSSNSSCPSSWLQYETICVLVSSEKMVWWKAWERCVQLNSHLAYIETEMESNILTGILVSLTVESVWIGLNDLEVAGSYVWADREPVTFTNYATGEPNRNASGRHEHCVAARRDNDYQWSDEYCFDEREFVCRTDLN
ncbi:perlucin [Procambarus clarkii]|uniref:perlucin n=1 Tax=Procambarus clarkii TaxID=6728 RepID=UPI001E671194|nr:low affinity immunoglobulin epsilon Fc receptor-like [Procambarus clarkii]